MANTIRASKNTFLGGLVMDLAPDTTPNEVLTSALNATLVTFNGNELLLQNDMGNGRVETARLPEGYIPVGTCEFGDIIYIVSYNPLTNKSLIGCFPSPERNVSSEEIGGTKQTLSSSDFQVLNDTDSLPTGELKANSVKKILYNNKLNPGDKFIIYDKNNNILDSYNNITDMGNTSHVYGSFPKLLRIHVVAIEDSGKINYLDSTLKWYSKTFNDNDYNDYNYFIQLMGSGIGGKKIDIDKYRDTLNSGYSVFQSKISGKLALLIELEKISGFSCSYNVYGGGETTIDDITYKKYKVFWNVSWETDDPEINPSYVVLTKSQWSGKQKGKEGKWYKYQKGLQSNEYELVMANPDPELNEEEQNDPLKDKLSVAYPNTDYQYWKIDSIDLDLLEYLDFNWHSSYKYILKWFLDRYSVDYGNMPLSKVNVYRRDIDSYKSCPSVYLDSAALWTNLKSTGSYYINATSINNWKKGIILTSEGKNKAMNPISVDDRIINNYFHSTIYFEGLEFEIPFKQTLSTLEENLEENLDVKIDITNLIYNYEITPAMPYGLLREYSTEGYIDFSKIGTGEINMTVWKYFIGENSATLTFGLDAYTEENMGISEVVMEFYDNLGMAAAYYLSGKESYSGQFTEMIPLNGYTTTYKLKNVDSQGIVHYHCGERATLPYDKVVTFIGDTPVKSEWSEGTVTYLDDCGTLYNNMLYLVKIVVKYCPLNALGLYDTTDTSNYRYFYRWMWTIPVFNDEYYHVLDFENLDLNLSLDINPVYETTENYYFKNIKYNSPNTKILNKLEDIYKYLSSNVLVLTSSLDVTVTDQTDELDPETMQPEEELTNIPIAVNIQRGKITDVTIYTNRTVRRVFPNMFTFSVDYQQKVLLQDYTISWDNGGTMIIIIPNEPLEYDSVVSVTGESGAFLYGNNLSSPAFNTSLSV